jgi:hypothetical protein
VDFAVKWNWNPANYASSTVMGMTSQTAYEDVTCNEDSTDVDEINSFAGFNI